MAETPRQNYTLENLRSDLEGQGFEANMGSIIDVPNNGRECKHYVASYSEEGQNIRTVRINYNTVSTSLSQVRAKLKLAKILRSTGKFEVTEEGRKEKAARLRKSTKSIRRSAENQIRECDNLASALEGKASA